MKLYRTILFAPGNRERMLQKVGKVGADAVVLDLEDAVPADEKDSTRAALGAVVETIAEEDGADVFVRVNPLDDVTGFSIACGSEDIAAVVGPALRGIVLPKAENPGQILAADRLIRDAERAAGCEAGGIHLLAILENARGVEDAFSIASADTGSVASSSPSGRGITPTIWTSSGRAMSSPSTTRARASRWPRAQQAWRSRSTRSGLPWTIRKASPRAPCGAGRSACSASSVSTPNRWKS